MSRVLIHPEVEQALAANKPVVALESAVITCGLPRDPFAVPAKLREQASEWNDRRPLNLEMARAMTVSVRRHGAVPALIAVLDGTLRIGLDDVEIHSLASDPEAGKAASSDLAAIMVSRKSAGTTVSATLAACGFARDRTNSGNRITCFATGGIGGVHRDWHRRPDISADLRALASTQVCVVSAGAKSILDLPATLEALQMLGVPVVGYQTDWFPHFHSTGEPASAGSTALYLTQRVNNAQDAAQLCHAHWHQLNQPSAVLLCNPIARPFAVDRLEIDLAIAEAERRAERRHITGPQRTPFLLNELADLTQGRSLIANIALLLGNAALAAEIAAAMVPLRA